MRLTPRYVILMRKGMGGNNGLMRKKKQMPNMPFVLKRYDADFLILPIRYLDELRLIPLSKLSNKGANVAVRPFIPSFYQPFVFWAGSLTAHRTSSPNTTASPSSSPTTSTSKSSAKSSLPSSGNSSTRPPPSSPTDGTSLFPTPNSPPTGTTGSRSTLSAPSAT